MQKDNVRVRSTSPDSDNTLAVLVLLVVMSCGAKLPAQTTPPKPAPSPDKVSVRPESIQFGLPGKTPVLPKGLFSPSGLGGEGKNSGGLTPEEFKAHQKEKAQKTWEEFERRRSELKRQQAASPEFEMYDGLRPVNHKISGAGVNRTDGRPISMDDIRHARRQAKQPFHFAQASAIGQQFLATARGLAALTVALDGPCEVRIRVCEVSGKTVLAEVPKSVDQDRDTEVKFTPPLPLQAGNFYRVEIERVDGTQPLGCCISEGNDIPFAQFEYRNSAGEWTQLSGSRTLHDLAMTITGHGHVSPGQEAAPARRALLVLLDREGVAGQVQALRQMPIATYIGKDLSQPLELAMNPGETLPELMDRHKNTVSSRVYRECPLPPQFANSGGEFDFSDDPPEYKRAVAERNAKAKRLHAIVNKPENWKVENRDLAELAQPVLAKVQTEFTAASIAQEAAKSYDNVQILEAADLRPDRVLQAISRVAPGHRLDIHVLAGGTSEGIGVSGPAGNKSMLGTDNFFVPLKRACLQEEMRLHLENVYLANSFGNRWRKEWEAVGAKWVTGRDRVNYLPHQYTDFLKMTVSAAQELRKQNQSRPSTLGNTFWQLDSTAADRAFQFASKLVPAALDKEFLKDR